MSFIVYLAVLVATVFSVALEWDSFVEPSPVAYHAVQVQAPAPLAAPVAREATPDNPPEKSAASVPAAPPPAAPAQPSVKCDVEACTAAYRTFRASDCTYNSNSGRRLCTKGEAQADSAESAVANCHIRACSESYSSFNPTDCTYQPLEGPRRLCEK